MRYVKQTQAYLVTFVLLCNHKEAMSQKNTTIRIAIYTIVSFFLCVGHIAIAATANLDKPFGEQTTMTGLVNYIFELGISLCVLTAAIYIAWGSLHYFYAAGDAKKAGEGKEIISRAITGLILALISWIILNTIHPQFAEKLEDPKYSNSSGS